MRWEKMDRDFTAMITLNDYFDRVVWIGSIHRQDRASQMEAMLAKFKIKADRFEAHWKPIDHASGQPSGNFGCTSSHRGVLELICHHGWKRTLIMEDDAAISPQIGDAFPDTFDSMVRDVPDDWSFLFLGAGYAEDPIGRINGSVIRAGRLLTTSSYGITLEMARKIAPHIFGVGPIDSLYGGWQREAKTYVFSPRLMIQADGWSDLANNFSRNSNSMLDTHHENLV